MTYRSDQQSSPKPAMNFDDDRIFVKRYITMFFSNWYWFAISLFFALTFSYGINRYSEKVYVVSSTLLIKDDMMGGATSYADNFLPGQAAFKTKQNLNNEIGILKSYRLNKRVMDSLPEFRIIYTGIGRRNIAETRLYKTVPFKVVPNIIDNQPHRKYVYIELVSDSSFTIEFEKNNGFSEVHYFGDRIFKNGFDFQIYPRFSTIDYDPDKSNKFFFYFTEGEGLANNYRYSLSITPISNESSLVNLTVSGFVPAQLAEYLNKVMEVYIVQGLEDRNRTADSTIRFINNQLFIIADSLTRAEDDLQNFRLRNNLVDISREAIDLQDKLKTLDNESVQLKLKRQYFNYLISYIDSKDSSRDIISPSTMGITDNVVGNLAGDLRDLQAKRREMELNIDKDLPALMFIDNNIKSIRAAINENASSNLDIIDSMEADINLRLTKVSAQLMNIPALERRMISIQRKFDINNTIYTYLLEKRAETGIARASTVADNRIIDDAKPFNWSQIKPNKSKNNLKAFVLGLFIPGILIISLYYFNNTIMDNNDISEKTNVPVIGVISHSQQKRELPTFDNPKSALSESFRSIRTALRYFIREEKNPVIAVTSTISNEGKTFISLNLASIMAQLGKKVLLIGLDLRKPRIHRILDLDNSKGLSSYLSNFCEFKDVIEETQIKNLFYAKSGPVPPNPAELIESERMSMFINKAKEEFDYIIIDTPPVAIVSDTLLLSKFVDINLFVVRQRYSSRNTLELIQELYESGKLKNMCLLINDINISGYYGYGYSDKQQDYYE